MHLSRILAGIVLCVLTFISVYARKYNYSGLLLVAPRQDGSRGVSMSQLEKISCMLTYEIRSHETVRAVNAVTTVNFIETNDMYPYVMSYSPLNGSFFTKESFENQKKVVCVNRKAAFELFGDVNVAGSAVEINNEIYIVTGVINDNYEDDMNIYAPARDESPNVFMVQTDNIDYTKNEFKEIGITESNYDFVELELISRAIIHKAISALTIFASGIVIFAVNRRFFTIAAVFGVVSWLFTQYTGSFLSWRTNAPLLRSLDGLCFKNEIKFLQSMELYSNIFSSAFIIFVLIVILPETMKSN